MRRIARSPFPNPPRVHQVVCLNLRATEICTDDFLLEIAQLVLLAEPTRAKVAETKPTFDRLSALRAQRQL